MRKEVEEVQQVNEVINVILAREQRRIDTVEGDVSWKAASVAPSRNGSL